MNEDVIAFRDLLDAMKRSALHHVNKDGSALVPESAFDLEVAYNRALLATGSFAKVWASVLLPVLVCECGRPVKDVPDVV